METPSVVFTPAENRPSSGDQHTHRKNTLVSDDAAGVQFLPSELVNMPILLETATNTESSGDQHMPVKWGFPDIED